MERTAGADGSRRAFREPSGSPAPPLRPFRFPSSAPIPMRRILFACALLLAAAPAAAQPTIQPGQHLAGELSASDPVLQDGSHYDLWRFAAQEGHVYMVTLRSRRFDAFLAVGAGAGDECDGCRTDDDGAGGTDAAVRFTPPAGGTYEIRANSYGDGETGAYELTLEDEGVAAGPGSGSREAVSIEAGAPVAGRLEAGDEEAANGAYSDTYLYHGRRGETIVITLRSAEFDAVVAAGRPGHSGCRPIDSDDNGAGGTDSKLKVVFQEDADYHIHVRTAQPSGRGAYTLTVERN